MLRLLYVAITVPLFWETEDIFFKLQQNISSSKRLTGLVGTLWDIFLYVQRERITMFQLGTYL